MTLAVSCCFCFALDATGLLLGTDAFIGDSLDLMSAAAAGPMAGCYGKRWGHPGGCTVFAVLPVYLRLFRLALFLVLVVSFPDLQHADNIAWD